MAWLQMCTLKITLCVLSLSLWVTRSVGANTALHCKDCNFTRAVNEDIDVGDQIFRLPIADVTDVRRVVLESGNENGQFSINQHGVVYLAKLLDYDISKEYHLLISIYMTDGIKDNLTLSITVNDVMNWPPVFNESCALPSNKTNKGLLYNILVGKGHTPLETPLMLLEDNTIMDAFYSNTSNSDCSAYLYFVTKRGKHSVAQSNHFNVQCDNMITISIEVLPVDNKTGIDYPQWFDHPLSYYVFVLIKLSPMPLTATEGVCMISTSDLTFTTEITVLPLGCPPGKYGFKCENDCLCKNGARCHSFNGACQCTAGWRGPSCDVPSLKTVEITERVIEASYGDIMTMCCLTYHLVVEDDDIVWYRGDEILDEDTDTRLNFRHKDGNSSITIVPVTDSDAGIYECEVKDKADRKHRAFSELRVTGCRGNTWGPTCSKTCNCRHGASCDRYEGCLCLVGWNGTTCSDDVQVPIIAHCPDDKVVLTDGQNTDIRVIWKEPNITDNSEKLNVTSNFKPGDSFGQGTHHVVYQAVDEGQNVASCRFSITVKKSVARDVSAVFIGVVSSLTFLCLAGQYLVYKYRHEIQAIIAHKLQAYEDDDQRKFDAFVSVKGDTAEEEFVYKILLPVLEKEYGYRLCVHHRDFVIGEAIVENILKSIQESRRTILVLSPAFVESEWCDYEVALAHTEMIALRQKLIPIMFEDITRMANIRASLQAILNTITYIQWPGEGAGKEGEKFWKRLVKAMPKRRNRVVHAMDRPPSKYRSIRNRFCNAVCRFRGNWNNRRRNDSVESDLGADDEIPLMALNHC